MIPLPSDIDKLVTTALNEDILEGDVTAELIDPSTEISAMVVCRENATLCGSAWFDEVFKQLDDSVLITWMSHDGDAITTDQMICTIEGPARPVLTGERSALNLLQTLSGTATLASRYAKAMVGTECRLLDTRKTLPGLRNAQKYAVKCGGAYNHRMGLYDAILIKENHINSSGSITAAVAKARDLHPSLTIEVEVENMQEFDEALTTDTNIIMLDNFALNDIHKAVAKAKGKAKLEVSGGLDLKQVNEIAKTGVDYVSVGALTKHVRAVDFSMRFI